MAVFISNRLRQEDPERVKRILRKARAARTARAGRKARAPAEPEFVTVGEFARITCLSRSGVYKQIESGQVPARRIGGAVRIPRSYLDALRQGPTAPTPAAAPPPEPAAEPAPKPRPRRARGASRAELEDWRAVLGIQP